MLRVLVMLLATAAPVLAAEGPVCVENATIVELQKALAAGTRHRDRPHARLYRADRGL